MPNKKKKGGRKKKRYTMYKGIRHCTGVKTIGLKAGGRALRCSKYAKGRGKTKRNPKTGIPYSHKRNARRATRACKKGKNSAMAIAWQRAKLAGRKYLTAADIKRGWENCGPQ